MHEAALNADEDPDRLSFLHAVRVVRRKMTSYIPPSEREAPLDSVLEEILQERAGSSRGRLAQPRGGKETENERLSAAPRHVKTPPPVDIGNAFGLLSDEYWG